MSGVCSVCVLCVCVLCVCVCVCVCVYECVCVCVCGGGGGGGGVVNTCVQGECEGRSEDQMREKAVIYRY